MPADGVVSLTASEDTYVRGGGGSTSNFGSDVEIRVRSQGASSRRTLLKFDLTSIPTGASVSSAILKLCPVIDVGASEAGSVHEIYRATSAWSEATVTWNTQPPIAAQVTDLITLIQGPNCYAFSVGADVQSWLSGASNDGWLVKDSNEGGTPAEVRYASREAVDPLMRPQLVVTYTY